MANFNNILNCANTNLAHNGANSDITSLTGLTTGLGVSVGGTGATTLTAHGVLLGEGTSAITPTAVGTNGQMLLGQSSADPTWNTMSGDATISASGALTVASGAITGGKIASSTIGGSNIASNTVANSNLANMAGHTYKGNNTGSSAAPSDVTVANLLTDLGFVTSGVGANGSITLPSGLIIKWGDAGVVAGGGGTATVTFGTAFPNNIWSVVALAVYGSSGQGTYNGNSPSTSGFTFKNTGSPSTSNAYWIAIGN